MHREMVNKQEMLSIRRRNFCFILLDSVTTQYGFIRKKDLLNLIIHHLNISILFLAHSSHLE